MKKIKKLDELQNFTLNNTGQKKLIGGGAGLAVCDEGDGYTLGYDEHGNVVCIDDGTGGGSGTPGGGNSQCNSCGGTCWPGDNVDFSSWIGTKLAQQMF